MTASELQDLAARLKSGNLNAGDTVAAARVLSAVAATQRAAEVSALATCSAGLLVRLLCDVQEVNMHTVHGHQVANGTPQRYWLTCDGFAIDLGVHVSEHNARVAADMRGNWRNWNPVGLPQWRIVASETNPEVK